MGRAGRAARGQLVVTLGGAVRTQVIIALGGVLALSSADAATVGASATQLRHALHISNTDIGLLVGVSSLVGAFAALPFGVLADRAKRTVTLALTVILWGIAMIWSAIVGTFGDLLLARLALGVVTASAGPIVASLVGDYFPSAERGQVYSYILAGELAGAGIGFAVTGDIASLSWRAAFFILALPAFFLAWFVWRLPEPTRGGRKPLFRDGEEPQGPPSLGLGHRPPPETDAQRLAREKGITADPNLVLHGDARRMGLVSATRYLFRIRSQVILIVASACVYFYLSGIETFGVEFAKEQFKVGQAVANGLVLLIGVGAVVGVLVGGGAADRLMRRRYLKGRILVPAIAAIVSVVAFVPALLSRSVVAAVPYFMIAAFGLTAQNPPIDAARLDITPPLLWGRAEAIRTCLRTLAQSLAPILFGAMSGLFGSGRSGLQITFIVLLIPLAANGYFLLRGLRTYPQDVATAAASAAQDPGPREGRGPGEGHGGGAESPSGPSGSGGPGPERWRQAGSAPREQFDPWAPPATWEAPRPAEPDPRGGSRGSGGSGPERWQPPERWRDPPQGEDPPRDPPTWEPPPRWQPPSR